MQYNALKDTYVKACSIMHRKFHTKTRKGQIISFAYLIPLLLTLLVLNTTSNAQT